MENGLKWSWKVLKNAHKKVLESQGKPLSVFCMHPVICVCPKRIHMSGTNGDGELRPKGAAG